MTDRITPAADRPLARTHQLQKTLVNGSPSTDTYWQKWRTSDAVAAMAGDRITMPSSLPSAHTQTMQLVLL